MVLTLDLLGFWAVKYVWKIGAKKIIQGDWVASFTLILNYIINSLNYSEIMEVVILSNCCLDPCIFLSAFSSWQIGSLLS